MTPHISAKREEIAETVILFGDPIRCRRAAEKYLSNAKEVSNVRGACFFTGEHNGRKFTLGTHGMGSGSMGIYSYELFKFYEVKRIIRVGTSGAYATFSVGDKMLVSESISDSSIFAEVSFGQKIDIAKPSPELTDALRKSAAAKGIKLHEGRVHSTDVFYSIRKLEDTIRDKGAKFVEMESYALFVNALGTNRQAACMLCISDTVYAGTQLSSDERVLCCDDLVEIALNIEI